MAAAGSGTEPRWVLSQVKLYPGPTGAAKLPRVVGVRGSRAQIMALLAAEAERCFGEYNERRLTLSGPRGVIVYPKPEGLAVGQAGGDFAVARVRAG